MTAAWVQAIAAWVRPVMAALGWAWRSRRKIAGRREQQALAREQQQREVLNEVITASAVTAVTLALTATLVTVSRGRVMP